MSVARIETARLAGERTRADHLDVLAQLFADPAVAATLWPEHLGGPRTRQQTAALLEHDVQHWERHGFGAWIFVSKHCGDAVTPPKWPAPPPTPMRLGLPEIVGFTLTTNHASQRVLAMIGVRHERTCSTRELPHWFGRCALPASLAP